MVAMLLLLCVGAARVSSSWQWPAPATSQTSSVLLFVAVPGASLGRELPAWVYLPPGYDQQRERYPVLYLLHGLGGGVNQWRNLDVFARADELILAGEIPPMMIVTPEGERGYWMNHVGGGPRWGDFITRDLIPYIDTQYRTIATRDARAIGGISMGGHGAIQLALNNPDLFVAAGGHSPVFRSQQDAFDFFGTGTSYRQRDPVSLVEDGTPVPFALWIDMGSTDQWLPRTREFNALLQRRAVPHTWHLWPGGHTDTYWKAHVPAYLRWYSALLARVPTTD